MSTSNISLMRASQLIHIIDTLEKRGGSTERVLREANLQMWRFCEPDDLIPTRDVYALLHRAAISEGCPTLGLLVGVDHKVTDLGSFSRLITSSLTIYDAMERTCRLMSLYTSYASYWLTEADDEVWICRNKFFGPDTGRREMEHYILLKLIDIVRLGVGPSWYPTKVFMQAHAVPSREVRDTLGDGQIHIGQDVTAIAVPREITWLPLRRRGAFGANQQQRFRETAPASAFTDAVRQLVTTLLQDGSQSIETVAEVVGLSVRSLQRRLAENGLSYSQLVDQARFQSAVGLLDDAENRVLDIAFELGYADAAHFTRAFKRWSGVSPQAYRHHRESANLSRLPQQHHAVADDAGRPANQQPSAGLP